jgi:hypothetical protein
LDGSVDLTDFTTLAANFNGSSKTWSLGDFSGDGSVDLTDFTILAAHFNQNVGTMSEPSPGATVPEPIGILVLAVVGSLARRHPERTPRRISGG